VLCAILFARKILYFTFFLYKWIYIEINAIFLYFQNVFCISIVHVSYLFLYTIYHCLHRANLYFIAFICVKQYYIFKWEILYFILIMDDLLQENLFLVPVLLFLETLNELLVIKYTIALEIYNFICKDKTAIVWNIFILYSMNEFFFKL